MTVLKASLCGQESLSEKLLKHLKETKQKLYFSQFLCVILIFSFFFFFVLLLLPCERANALQHCTAADMTIRCKKLQK